MLACGNFLIKFSNIRKKDSHFLDSRRKPALIRFVSTLGISQRERFFSRMRFYLVVVTVMWSLNHALPAPAEFEARNWEALGVMRPYLGVPFSEVDFSIFGQSR